LLAETIRQCIATPASVVDDGRDQRAGGRIHPRLDRAGSFPAAPIYATVRLNA
jgi:hypothetical protein